MTEYMQSRVELAHPAATRPLHAPPHLYVPQFSASDYGRRPSIRCSLCSNFAYSEYFKVNGQKICSTCAEEARSGQSTASRASLTGALIFGTIGAMVAMIFYAAVTISTGWTMGYVALAAGWIVGKSVMAGANNVGSTRLQLIAMALTYLAITLEAIPGVLYEAYNYPATIHSWGTLLPNVIISGLISPFTHFDENPVNAAIRLLILLIGLRIAWRLTQTRPLAVAGPFAVATAQK
jgi:hypothetical protein